MRLGGSVPRPLRIIRGIEEIQVIAAGRSLRERGRLARAYGGARWRKLKGTARVQLPSGRTARAELHWYEAHGVGRRELKIKHLLS